MNANNKSRKQIPNSEQKLTRDIVISYLTLLAILMIAPAKLVHADFNVSMSDNNDLDSFPTLIAVGRGELTWFGISIYEASLWTTTGEFQNLTDTLPVAFTITYERNITSSALAKRTVKEWEHLNILDKETRTNWGNELKTIWPDVKPGDSITTLVTALKTTRFYHNNKLLTVLEDPSFGTALLSIWLDANTSEPDLRAKLIGQKEANNE